jgi:hypothetical protein
LPPPPTTHPQYIYVCGEECALAFQPLHAFHTQCFAFWQVKVDEDEDEECTECAGVGVVGRGQEGGDGVPRAANGLQQVAVGQRKQLLLVAFVGLAGVGRFWRGLGANSKNGRNAKYVRLWLQTSPQGPFLGCNARPDGEGIRRWTRGQQ